MIKTYLALTLAGLTLTLPSPAHAKHPPKQQQPILYANRLLATEDRQHLLTEAFTVVKTVGEIPAPVRKVLALDAGVEDGMANPGQRFQVTDAGGPDRLPLRRLVFAANSPHYSLIYDEHGGIVYYQHASLYRLTGGQPKLVWQADIDPVSHFLSFAQLRTRLCTRKYHVGPHP